MTAIIFTRSKLFSQKSDKLKTKYNKKKKKNIIKTKTMFVQKNQSKNPSDDMIAQSKKETKKKNITNLDKSGFCTSKEDRKTIVKAKMRR